MGCILETLRCLLCCDEDDYVYHDYEPLQINTSSPLPTTSFRAPLIRGEFVKHLWVDSKSSALIKPEFINRSLAKPQENCQKPKIFAPFPSIPPVNPRSSIDSGINKRNEPSRYQNPSPTTPIATKSFNNSEGKKPEVPKISISSVLHRNATEPPSSSFKPAPLYAVPPCLSHSIDSNPRSSIDSGINKRNEPSRSQNPSPTTPIATKSFNNSEGKKPEVPKISISSVLHRNATDPPSSSFKPAPLYAVPPSLSHSDPPNTPNKTKYVQDQKETTPLYAIPEEVEKLIKNDIVPGVLKKPLSPSSYRDYFAALLYAEDFYLEKWSKFRMRNVTLELHEAEICAKWGRNKISRENDERDERIFVAFEIDSVPERRPFLLSRDYVLLRPSGKMVEPFQGILNRVVTHNRDVKSTIVLAEFGDDFHSQHRLDYKYDVSFSFNRVCLKRAHQAVEKAAMKPLLQSVLFPNHTSRTSVLTQSSAIPSHRNLDKKQANAVYNISRLKGSPPYLIEGPRSVEQYSRQEPVSQGKTLSATGLVIKEAVSLIFRTSPGCRILINAPTNKTCDVLWRSLTEEIPKSDMFRANAAFRELDGVPCDVRRSCPFEGECFTCPSLQELKSYKVVLSTFVSSFRLYNEGISSGHFSHIFLVDASSATEPEIMVSLANLADEKTVIVVIGAIGDSSGWVRSDIARRNGLKKSYFQRLFESKPYRSVDAMFVTRMKDK